MQLIISFSRFLILALVCATLLFLLAWKQNDNNFAAPLNLIPSNATLKSVADMELVQSIHPILINTVNVNKKAVKIPASTIWSTLRKNMKLDHYAQTARVQAEIRKLLAERNKLNQILNDAGPYIYYIYQQTQTHGLPAELSLIPFIESEFNPYDHSNAGATGLWQLMSGTARILGVKVKYGYDGRRNLVSSTKAALVYFRDLNVNFKGNWYLAIAAYNCGQGRIESAVRRAGSRSFWNLSVPRETKYYVPKLLAIAAIVKNPEKYGVKLPPIKNKPYFTEFKTSKSVNLTQIAKSSGTKIDVLHKLNPDYKNATVPKETTLLVPIKA